MNFLFIYLIYHKKGDVEMQNQPHEEEPKNKTK